MKTFIKDYWAYLIILLCFGLFACPPPGPTNEDLLTLQRSLVSVSVNGNKVNVSGFSFQFKSDRTFIFFGPHIANLPSSGSWALNDAGNLVTLNDTFSLTVKELEASRLVLQYSYVNHKEQHALVEFILE